MDAVGMATGHSGQALRGRNRLLLSCKTRGSDANYWKSTRATGSALLAGPRSDPMLNIRDRGINRLPVQQTCAAGKRGKGDSRAHRVHDFFQVGVGRWLGNDRHIDSNAQVAIKRIYDLQCL